MMERDFCIMCGFDKFVDHHHLIPKAKGGMNNDDNLVLLCPNCHRAAHLGMLNPSDLRYRKRLAEKKTAIYDLDFAQKARELMEKNSSVAGL
jgi:5-methylcytosine-specific restriction endonuclease McrA